jgi:hypothetical protein
MARRVLWAVLLGAAAGCADGTRAIMTARPVESGPADKAAAELAAGKKPDKSDPAAEAVVKAALDAHTGGKPDLLQKLKSVRFTRDTYGTVGTTQPARSKWEVHAVWPDRIRQRVEMTTPQGVRVACECRNRDEVWLAVGGDKQVMSADQAAGFKIDVSAEWLWMLFPLAEPGTVVATAPDADIAGKPAAGVRVWAAGITDAVLYFDKETKLFAGMTFDGRDGTQRVVKDVHVLGSKSYDGITLPERMVLKANNRQVAEWTMPTFEPQPGIDPKLFENP